MKFFSNNLLHMAILGFLDVCALFLLLITTNINLHQELENVFSQDIHMVLKDTRFQIWSQILFMSLGMQFSMKLFFLLLQPHLHPNSHLILPLMLIMILLFFLIQFLTILFQIHLFNKILFFLLLILQTLFLQIRFLLLHFNLICHILLLILILRLALFLYQFLGLILPYTSENQPDHISLLPTSKIILASLSFLNIFLVSLMTFLLGLLMLISVRTIGYLS